MQFYSSTSQNTEPEVENKNESVDDKPQTKTTNEHKPKNKPFVKIFMPEASQSIKNKDAKDNSLMPMSTYLNLRDNILFNIYKDNSENIPMYIPNPLRAAQQSELNSVNVSFGFNITNGKLLNIYPRYYNKIEPTQNIPPLNPDIIFEFRKLFNNDRNITSINVSRAVMNAIFATQKNVADQIYYAAKYILSYLHDGKLNLHVHNILDIQKTNNIRDNYINYLLASRLFVNCSAIKTPLKELNFNEGPKLIPVHKLVSIPKDISKKLQKIGKYFTEVKSQLILNEENGYYCYKVDDILIPIICTHEYMTYDGESPEQIALKCYNDGKCKYCDQEIAAYTDQYREELPSIIYSLIIRFIESIMDDIDVDALHFALFNMIYDTLMNIKKYRSDDGTIVATACIFLYKIYLATNGEIKFNSAKIMKFTDSMRKYCSAIGWSNQTIESIMNDPKYIPQMSNLADIIKSFAYTTNVKYCDTLPLSILFGEIINPTLMENQKLNAKTNMQKLYVEGWSKMQQLNNTIQKALLKSISFEPIEKLNEKLSTHPLHDKIEYITPAPIKNGRNFYNAVYEWYCPTSPTNLHKWSDKCCHYCGLNKDYKNKESVYEKYQLIINNSSTQQPDLNTNNVFMKQKQFNTELLQKYDPKTAFTTYITPRDHRVIDIFNERFKDKKYQQQICKYISRVIHIPIQNIEQSEDTLKKYLCYIVDQKLDTVEKVIDELKYIFINVNDKQLLLMIYTKDKGSKDKEKEKEKDRNKVKSMNEDKHTDSDDE